MSDSYPKRFSNHIHGFLNAHNPSRSRRVVVAVSGGLDSMLLMNWANTQLKKDRLDSLRVLTVDHGTRPGQEAECVAVKFEAQKLELSCEILLLHLGEATKNLEASLRRARHSALKAALDEGEDLWMGHHIDDSWEWSTLQSLRSSSMQGQLGIPLRHGPVLRPFMCVTRAQIKRCADEIGLLWQEDPTNDHERFERNWLRQWAQPLKDRHPSYLKHYARRCQRMSDEFGVSLRRYRGEVYQYPTATLVRGDISPQRWANEVARLSTRGRGKIAGELEKVRVARENDRRGPHALSGGVKVHLWGDWVLITSAQHQFQDGKLSGEARDWSKSEFSEFLATALQQESAATQAPFWVEFSPEQNSQNVLVRSGADVAWPQLTARTSPPVISAFKLLERWQDPQVSLRIAPLF